MDTRFSVGGDEGRKLRVLVVDDSSAMKSMLTRAIQQTGCVVVGLASNGTEAVDMYKKLGPDLVTMDIEMPEVTGKEALKAIMEYDRGAVIIMVTSVNHKDTVIECIRAGAKNYILKPFTPDSVKAAIAKCFPRVFA